MKQLLSPPHDRSDQNRREADGLPKVSPVIRTREPIRSSDRLIFALDVPHIDEAREFVDRLGDAVTFYKLGLELLMVDGFWGLVRELVGRHKKVMVDLKMWDIPETVRRAVSQLNEYGVTFATIHSDPEIARAAVAAAASVQILMVTALTNLDVDGLRQMGHEVDSVEEFVLHMAGIAVEAGCHGVVASGHEAGLLRTQYAGRLTIVTPGIRPTGGVLVGSKDDQKRVVTPAKALSDGADHIVVGRPIRDASDPRAAAEAIQREISQVHL